jgi:hypothetical protein
MEFPMLKKIRALWALVLAAAIVHAQTCRWDATAPFCIGSCGGGKSEAMT